MNVGRTVFSQLMDFVPRHEFRQAVERYDGNYRVRTFTCWDQFLCMCFAQLTYRESLRDIEACLRAVPDKLYHMGIRAHVSRNTLAVANEKRDWRIYAEVAHWLIDEARRLYAAEPLAVALKETVYALDSTTIDLCLSVFPWAHFKKTKGAVKIHTLLDLRGSIPSFIRITHGKVGDVLILDELIPEPNAIYVMDRGYVDFTRLYRLTEWRAVFVIRAKKDLKYRRLYSRPVDKTTGLICDQIIVLTGRDTRDAYPAKLRRVRYQDLETGKDLTFLTNDFSFPALTIARLYQSRWGVELFFKWIKQHLRIKSFFGTSPNAVRTQIWIAICAYLLVAIARKRLGIEQDLHSMLQVLSISLFEKALVRELLSPTGYTSKFDPDPNQLPLFDL
jgi:hypothetical protein